MIPVERTGVLAIWNNLGHSVGYTDKIWRQDLVPWIFETAWGTQWVILLKSGVILPGNVSSAYWRISAFIPLIFDPPETSANPGNKWAHIQGRGGFRTGQNLAKMLENGVFQLWELSARTIPTE